MFAFACISSIDKKWHCLFASILFSLNCRALINLHFINFPPLLFSFLHLKFQSGAFHLPLLLNETPEEAAGEKDSPSLFLFFLFFSSYITIEREWENEKAISNLIENLPSSNLGRY